MVTASGESKVVEVVQSVAVMAAIPLGVVPLVRYIANDDHGGLFRTLFGEHTGGMAVTLPVLVIAAAVAVIGVSEVAKRRGRAAG